MAGGASDPVVAVKAKAAGKEKALEFVTTTKALRKEGSKKPCVVEAALAALEDSPGVNDDENGKNRQGPRSVRPIRGPKQPSSLANKPSPAPKQPAAVTRAARPQPSAGTAPSAGGSSHLFNTSDVVRPIPRKTPSETSVGSSKARSSHLFNDSSSTRPVPRNTLSENSTGAKSSVKTALAARGPSNMFDTSSVARLAPRKAPSETSMWSNTATNKLHPARHPGSKYSVASEGASHLFNTSNVARPIPRNMSSETSVGSKRPASENGNLPGSIPKKSKFLQPRQHQQMQSRQPSQQQLSPKGESATASATAPAVPLAGADLSANVNFQGRWRSRTRAPVGAGAIPLQKHTSTRMVRKDNKSAFTPPGGKNLGTEDPGSGSAASSAGGSNLFTEALSPGEIVESGLYVTRRENEGMHISDGSVADKDNGSSQKRASNPNENARRQHHAENDDTSDVEDEGEWFGREVDKNNMDAGGEDDGNENDVHVDDQNSSASGEKKNEDSEGGGDEKEDREGSAMELEDNSARFERDGDVMAVELENDLFYLVERTIENQAQWDRRPPSTLSKLQQDVEQLQELDSYKGKDGWDVAEMESVLKNGAQAMEVSNDAGNGNHANREENLLEPGEDWEEENQYYADDDSVSSAEVDIPVFSSCNKCGMVFGDIREAWEHENNCSITDEEVERGRVFDDEHLLMKNIINRLAREGRMVTQDDMIFFRSDIMVSIRDAEGRRSVTPDADINQ